MSQKLNYIIHFFFIVLLILMAIIIFTGCGNSFDDETKNVIGKSKVIDLTVISSTDNKPLKITCPSEACSRVENVAPEFFMSNIDKVCTTEYGGPETIKVYGVFKGYPVNRTFNKNNGCDISDFNKLEKLIYS